jgi:HK97 family phage prohead protease
MAKNNGIDLIESRDFFGDIEYRADSEGKTKKLRGYSARFGEITDLYWFEEEILPGAFRNAIARDDIRALIDHNPSLIIGRNKANTLELIEDERGLLSIIDPPDTSAGKDIVTSVDRGDVTGQSFSFRVREEIWISGKKRGEGKKDLRQLKDLELRDISIVTYPQYKTTDVSFRNKITEIRSLEMIYKNRFDHPMPNLSYYQRYLKRLSAEK